jgi:beta-lactamase regulating signal transducer with metallopeptidase domain
MNFIESLFSAEFIRAFAWTLFHSLWQGGLLGLMAAGIMMILRKHRPGIRYAILYGLMMLLPVIFAGTFLITYNQEKGQGYANVGTISSPYEQVNTSTDLNAVYSVNQSSTTSYSRYVVFFENQAKWLVLIWFTGFIFFLLRFSGSMLYVYRLKNHQVFSIDERWNVHLRKLSSGIGLQQKVRMAESALAKIPMTIGYLKPVILLPLGTLSGVPPQQIDAIILHELAHILRKDYILNIIQSVTEILFFYHPVTWWLSGLIRQEREHICDDLAISVNHDHINYIKALTTMEELNSKVPLLASAMTGSKKKLLCRVKRLLTPVKLRKGPGGGIIAFIFLIGLVFTLSFNALSFIPSSFDLTGRESGEVLYNLLPFKPEIPDTVVATSRSGKVKISVYTDSVSQVQQEQLQKMAESMDRQSLSYDRARKEYMVQIEDLDGQKDKCDRQHKVIVISKSDSASWDGDSVTVICKEMRSQHPGGRYGTRPPRYEDMRVNVFSYQNDSIDTLIFIGPGKHFDLGNLEEYDWSSEEMEERMKEMQIEMEGLQWSAEDLENRNMEIEIEMERDISEGETENLQFYFDEPIAPPLPPDIEFFPGPRITPAEKIIRQELRDDGLTQRGRKYIVEIDSKAMYINGEKQPKEVYRKYRKLVESFESMTLEGDEIFKLIF